jgi:hypothetical protein
VVYDTPRAVVLQFSQPYALAMREVPLVLYCNFFEVVFILKI